MEHISLKNIFFIIITIGYICAKKKKSANGNENRTRVGNVRSDHDLVLIYGSVYYSVVIILDGTQDRQIIKKNYRLHKPKKKI